MRAGLAVLALLLLAATARADAPPDPGRDQFYLGTNLERDGKNAEAVAVFRDLVIQRKGDPFADDALAEIGRIYEEKLGDPVKAAEAYEELVRDYPESRLALRAQRRSEALRKALGPANESAKPLAELNEILYGFARRPRAESIARAEKLLADYPEFSEAARATYWLGTAYLQDERTTAALAEFRAVFAHWPDSEWAVRAHKAEGDVLLGAGDYAGAERAYGALFGHDAEQDRAARDALAMVSRARWRARAYVASFVVIALGLLLALLSLRLSTGSVGAAARALIKPPVEFWYMLPIAALLFGAALTENSALGHAIELILVGGLITVWFSGATLEAAPARRLGRVLAHVVVAAAVVAAVCYVSVTREKLIDMLVETFKYGPD